MKYSWLRIWVCNGCVGVHDVSIGYCSCCFFSVSLGTLCAFECLFSICLRLSLRVLLWTNSQNSVGLQFHAAEADGVVKSRPPHALCWRTNNKVRVTQGLSTPVCQGLYLTLSPFLFLYVSLQQRGGFTHGCTHSLSVLSIMNEETHTHTYVKHSNTCGQQQ